MESENKKRLDELRAHLEKCGFTRSAYKMYGLENLYSVEWWSAGDEKQILIVVGDQSQFDLFRFLGDTFTTVTNFQTIAQITFANREK